MIMLQKIMCMENNLQEIELLEIDLQEIEPMEIELLKIDDQPLAHGYRSPGDRAH